MNTGKRRNFARFERSIGRWESITKDEYETATTVAKQYIIFGKRLSFQEFKKSKRK